MLRSTLHFVLCVSCACCADLHQEPTAGSDRINTCIAILSQQVALLDALGANLASEQQELARQDFVLFRQLLTPIQASFAFLLVQHGKHSPHCCHCCRMIGGPWSPLQRLRQSGV